MRIVLTQSEGRLAGLERRLRSAGHEVLRLPLVRTELVAGVRVEGLLECPWLLFTSRSSVEAWRSLELSFGRARLGALGEGTARALRSAGGAVGLRGEPATAAGLAAAFLEHPEARGPVGLPQGDRALSTLQAMLERNGFETRPLVLYRSLACPWRGEAADLVVLSSPSAVAALPEEVGARARLVALGPSTAVAIAERGWPCREAEKPDAEAVMRVLARWS